MNKISEIHPKKKNNLKYYFFQFFLSNNEEIYKEGKKINNIQGGSLLFYGSQVSCSTQFLFNNY